MSQVCEVVELASQPAIAVRARTNFRELSKIIDEAYDAISQYLGQMGEQPAGPPFVGFFNVGTDDLEVEAGFAVSRKIKGEGRFLSVETPGGRVGVCLHTGPYSESHAAYAELTRTVQELGLEPTGVSYEFYLNNPMDTSPEQLQTRIVFPLR